jgi:hypothetical protein
VTTPDPEAADPDGVENDIEQAAIAMDEIERRVAVHEAGHAVLAYDFGWEIDSVSIAPEAERDASARMRAVYPNTDLGHYVQVMLGGIVAVCIHVGCIVDDLKAGGKQDLQDIEDKFKKENTPASEQPIIKRDQRHAAEELLRHRWARVEALTEQLLRKTTISGAEVRAILAAVATEVDGGYSSEHPINVESIVTLTVKGRSSTDYIVFECEKGHGVTLTYAHHDGAVPVFVAACSTCGKKGNFKINLFGVEEHVKGSAAPTGKNPPGQSADR